MENIVDREGIKEEDKMESKNRIVKIVAVVLAIILGLVILLAFDEYINRQTGAGVEESKAEIEESKAEIEESKAEIEESKAEIEESKIDLLNMELSLPEEYRAGESKLELLPLKIERHSSEISLMGILEGTEVSMEDIETKAVVETEAESAEVETVEVVNTETSAVMTDFSKQKDILTNIHNKLIEAYSKEEWIEFPMELADDELGHDIGITRELYNTFVCQYSVEDNKLSMFLGIYVTEGKSDKVFDKLKVYASKFINKNNIVVEKMDEGYVYLVALNDNSRAVEVIKDSSNYIGVSSKVRMDKRYTGDGNYTSDKIVIPDIKSKEQNIVETEPISVEEAE